MFEKRKKYDARHLPASGTADRDAGSISDAELLAAFGKGDEKAFETLYYRYRKLLYGYLNNLCCGNHSEADEVFEETWLRVIEKAGKYRDDGKFSAWLFRISRNIFIDRLRRSKPEIAVEKSYLDAAVDKNSQPVPPSNEADVNDIQKVLVGALAELPPEQREVFLLREEELLSFREIAEIQECPVGTVLSRMRYALKSLRIFLTDIDSGGFLR